MDAWLLIWNDFVLWLSNFTLVWLFVTGFLSATLLPGGSEAALIVALNQNEQTLWVLVVTATIGNALGGMTNYFIGYCLPNKAIADSQHNQKILPWLRRYGYWGLLLSWLPIVGDPLCLMAGWLRMKAPLSLLVITVGKLIRYSVLATLYLGFF
ncbi:DedA family protein [Vibrio sp.]|nr:DedA family protein [Vibrio sp.]